MDIRAFSELARNIAGLTDEQIQSALLLVQAERLSPLQLTYHLVGEKLLSDAAATAILRELALRRVPPPDLSGRTLGKFRIVRPLDGRSRWLAAQPGLDIPAVIQVVDAWRRDEASALSRLSHPALARVQDFGTERGVAFVVLEYVDGEPLRARDWNTTRTWMIQIAEALRTIHDAGLVHRNIAPSSIVVDRAGNLRVVDFGLDNPDGDATSTSCVSPELLRGEPGDRRSDLYSLGATFYHVVAHVAPFDSLLTKMRERPSADPLVKSGTPAGFRAVLLKLLDPRPAERYPDALTLIREVRTLHAIGGPAAPAAPPPPPLLPPAPKTRPVKVVAVARSRNVPLIIALASLPVIAAIAITVAVALSNEKPTSRLPIEGPVPPPPPQDAPPERGRADALEKAIRAEHAGLLEDALRAYREAQYLGADVSAKITELEAKVKAASEESVSYTVLLRQIEQLSPRAAMSVCDDFIANYPESKFVEKVLELKMALSRRLETPPPPVEKPPEEPARITKGRAMHAPILGALLWLARHQNADGTWGMQNHVKNCRGEWKCEPNPGDDAYDPGITALALLAFVSAGYGAACEDIYEGHRFGDVVKRAAVALMGQMSEEGCIGKKGTKYMYNHAVAATALCATLRLGGVDGLRASAQRAIDYILQARNPGRVWRYSPRCGDNDTSVTGWAVGALRAAETAHLTIVADVMPDVRAWCDAVTETTGRVGYTHKGTGRVFVPGQNEHFEHHETMSAIAAMIQKKMDARVAAMLLNDLPVWRKLSVDFYYWHCATIALQAAGGANWAKWKAAVAKVLTDYQEPAAVACRVGSWPPVDRWSFEGGRVYATALNALTLLHALSDSAVEKPPEAKAAWIFELTNGGRVRAASYEEKGDSYVIKLPGGGSSTVPKADVARILKEK